MPRVAVSCPLKSVWFKMEVIKGRTPPFALLPQEPSEKDTRAW